MLAHVQLVTLVHRGYGTQRVADEERLAEEACGRGRGDGASVWTASTVVTVRPLLKS